MSIRKLECPKCSSRSAWTEIQSGDLVLRCLCGLNSVLETRARRLQLVRVESVVRLPKPGTLIRKTLYALEALRLDTTAAVQQGLLALVDEPIAVPDVACYLVMLRNKGLVEQVEYRRGQKGGSTWRLSAAAIKLLEVH